MVTAAIDKQAFTCPHCGAMAHQDWYEAFASRINRDDDKLPRFYDPEKLDEIEQGLTESEADQGVRNSIKMARRSVAGEVFVWGSAEGNYSQSVANLHMSECFSCKKFTVWLAEKQTWPAPVFDIAPSHDMPEDVRSDFEEARAVLDASPRAAAALLRSAIERLCNAINGSHDDIFTGIGKLVEKGLDVRIQKALDVVRVTGNDAVHPNSIDRGDDKETAVKLFKLVNLIVEKLISDPKEIDTLFDGMPETKRAAIERRDSKK
ncbi:DUF4145 domain-containing protein [Glycocaulis sp.]|uniref:DUF4145 domain-containing protein n=1 Tax=Glycocaulis sp. TaxID=1969725 RepID=UPI003D2448E2